MSVVAEPKPVSFEIPVGFYVPGVLAAYMYKAAEDGKTCEQMNGGLRRLMDEFTATCPACGNTWQFDLLDEPTEADLYELASEAEYGVFLDEVERRYAGLDATCPACGVQGRLAANTLGDDEEVGS